MRTNCFSNRLQNIFPLSQPGSCSQPGEVLVPSISNLPANFLLLQAGN